MSYSSDSDYADRVQNRIDRDTAYAGDRERSVASKVYHAVKDIAVAVVTYVLGPVAGVVSSIVGAVLDFIFD
jgi:hypothetical protein